MKSWFSNWTRRSSHRERRAGYSLIEMVLYISLVGLFSPLFAVLLQRAGQAGHDTTMMLLDARQLYRFHRDWTEDVHAALRADLLVDDPDSGTLRLELGDGTVVQYLWDHDRIRRRQWDDETLMHQEAYVLDNPLEVEWVVGRADGLLEVRLWRPIPSGPSHSLHRQIVARIGSQHHFQEGALP